MPDAVRCSERRKEVRGMRHSHRSPRTGRFVPAPRSTAEQLVNSHNLSLRIMRWLDAFGVAILFGGIGFMTAWTLAIVWGVCK